MEKSVGTQERRIRDTLHILKSSFLSLFLSPFFLSLSERQKRKKKPNQKTNLNNKFSLSELNYANPARHNSAFILILFFFHHFSCSESCFEFLLFVSHSLCFSLCFSISFLLQFFYLPGFSMRKIVRYFFFFILSCIPSSWWLLFFFLIADTFLSWFQLG